MRAQGPTPSGHQSSVVARETLFEVLSSALPGSITVLSAPAGSGKTVLLRSWIEAAGLTGRTAWVSVERDEREPQRFWLSVVKALRGAVGPQGPIEDLAPTPQFDGEAVVERLVSGVRSLDEPVVLVIDDLHQLLEPRAVAQLERLLASRPSQLQVILSTRQDPPLGLHRYRLAGELVEVRAADLRFGLDETRQLLAAAGVTLSDSAVRSAPCPDGGLGRGPPARGPLACRQSRPGALRRRVLGKRADRRRLPVRRGAAGPARTRAPAPRGNVDPGARERPARRSAPRDNRRRADPAGARGRRRVRLLDRPGAIVVPLPPAVRRSSAPGAAAHGA